VQVFFARESKIEMEVAVYTKILLITPYVDYSGFEKICESFFNPLHIFFQSTFQDYLELYLQFGYVFLFSAVYPLAAFWAVVNNVIEMRTDAFKLCNLHQRPFVQTASSIGAWQVCIFLCVVCFCTKLKYRVQIELARGMFFVQTKNYSYCICELELFFIILSS